MLTYRIMHTTILSYVSLFSIQRFEGDGETLPGVPPGCTEFKQ